MNTSFTGVPSLITGGPQSRSLSKSDVSGKIGLEYQLAERSLLYGSISRGTKSGGFTAHNTVDNPNAVDAFAPEKLTAYEIGVKSDVTTTLRINASVFYYNYEEQQVLSKVFDTGSQSYIGRFINSPKSEITGGELELQWQPVKGLDIQQYVSYKTGKYKANIINSEGVDFNGDDLSFPKFSYGGDVIYGFDVGSFKLATGINYSYHDKYAQLFLLGPNFTTDSYWLANAHISLAPAGTKSWSASIWGRNIFNARYDLTKNYFLPGTNIAAVGEPTTVGIRVDYSF